jgi:hypothetical protein
MKKVKSLYFIVALFFIIIIISLFNGSTENFDLEIIYDRNYKRLFKGPFDKTCRNCKWDEPKSTLKCDCKDKNNKYNPSTLLFYKNELQNLNKWSIRNNNGTLSKRSLEDY